MPTKPQQLITAWSYSRFNDWATCPLKARFKHVDKIREPDNEYQARGTKVHKEAEGWSTKKKLVVLNEKLAATGDNLVSCAKMPASLANFKEEFAVLRKVSKLLATEAQIGLDKTWGETEWFDSDARKKGLGLPWCRVTMDCRYIVPAKKGPKVLRVIDYKTGRVHEEHLLQLSLYAVAGFAIEDVDLVSCELWYLDQGVVNPPSCGDEPVEYRRDDAAELKREWGERVAPMLRDAQFRAKPGDHCRWCHYRKANKAAGGGQCRY